MTDMSAPILRCSALALALALDPLFTALADDPLTAVKPFLEKHCFDCHGPDLKKGDYRFDTLSTDLSNVKNLETWQNILDQLNLGEMPPKKKPGPPIEEVTPVVDTLTARLKLTYAERRSTDRQTVMRRMNRFELRYTLRDLLHLDGPGFRVGSVASLVDNNGNGRIARKGGDPVRNFPADEEEEGFDNIGDRLVMSDFLLKLTLAAAEESIGAATNAEQKPAVKTRRFAGHIQTGKTGGSPPTGLDNWSRELNPDYDEIFERYQRYKRLGPLPILRKGVGTSARYRITVEASGHNQKHPWGDIIKTNQNEPFILGLHLAVGSLDRNSIPLVQWELPGDGKKRTFTYETWIDESAIPWLGWENGFYDRRFWPGQLVAKYMPEAYRKRPDRKKVSKEEWNAWPREIGMPLLKAGYKGPSIRVYSLTLEPLIDAWPPKSHTSLYGTGPADKADIESLILSFAQRAFRRPVKQEEIARYVALVRSQMKAKESGGAIQNLTYKGYKGTWRKLPAFSSLTPIYQGSLANGLIDLRPSRMKDYFGMVFEGKLNAPRAGDYQFQIASDDGARVIVNGKKVVEHDGLHGASLKKGTIQLSAGTHKIQVEYFAFGSPNSFRASWSGPEFGSAPLSVGKSAPKQLTASNPQAAQAIKALQAGYTAMLCSPRFLYLKETNGRLDNYEIASRLSYFLWSSMPDDKLFVLAKAGKLTNVAVVQQQVTRMLKDPKSAAFTRHFPENWLGLDKMNCMPPERSGQFRVYWDRKLEPQMVNQTCAYFGDLVKTNGSIQRLINSDYTYLNETLASIIYGRNDIRGNYLRKVKLDDPRRGGIFTQPSVMVATANGVDTSPVVRGVWVLESVLGTPPPPPPPDVEPLSPDLRAAKTIRQQLELHRKQPACNSCHRKIDPMGFAMENFDPIGRWRDKYPKAKNNIDASSTLSTGRKMADIVEFKKMLLTRKDQVARCLTEKLLTYSSGRILEPTDRGEVDRIVSKLKEKGDGLSDLIHLVVQSDVFLTK